MTSHHSAAPQHSPFSSSPQITTTGGFSALIRPSPEGPWGASTPPHTTEATRLLGLPPLRRILRVMEDDLGEAALPTLREIFAVMGTTPQVIRFAQLQQLFNEISSRLKTLETKNNLYKLINEIIQT
ncbi:hypothetical protein KKB55_06490 [Myxococcota bacterium]|nr:hypothetical protein [Myxococcota bacterium]MBU1897402.1 hypothetical protein [Myxococcota bacterium]